MGFVCVCERVSVRVYMRVCVSVFQWAWESPQIQEALDVAN